MMTLLSQNIRKGVFSIRFVIAVALCVAAGIYNLLQNTMFNPNLLQQGTYNLFLGITLFGWNSFSYVAPIIAAIPASVILYRELEQRYAMQPIIRTGYGKYYWSQILSSAVCGAAAIIAGFIILFIISMIISPSASYRIQQVHPLTLFAYVYETSMLGYIALFTLNSAIFCAAYSVFATGIFVITNNYYAGYLIPTAFYCISTLSGGLLFGNINILPFCTFIINQVYTIPVVKDHMLVFALGITMSGIGFLKWRKLATY